MELAEMTTEQLIAALEATDKERMAAKKKGQAVKAVLIERQRAEHAAYHGLTPEGYDEAKKVANTEKIPFATVLGKFKKVRAGQIAREVQVAKVTPAKVGVTAKKAGS